MKLSLKLLIAACAQIIFLGACSKIDWDDIFKGPGKTANCDVAAFTFDLDPQTEYPFLFEKKYDPSGKVIKEINASFNNVLPLERRIHYRLRLEYRHDKIYFIRMESPFDTLITAFFNNQGRLTETLSKNLFYQNKFTYRQGKLFSIYWRTSEFSVTDTCRYDAHGNILSISHPESGDRDGYFFTYDYSRKANQQFYFEETRDLNNDFALMQYLGFFPELAPVNVRTASKLGLEHSYGFYHYLANHQFDAKGKLTGYDLTTDPAYPPVAYSHISVKWNCR